MKRRKRLAAIFMGVLATLSLGAADCTADRDIGDTDAGAPQGEPDPAARPPQPTASTREGDIIVSVSCYWRGPRVIHMRATVIPPNDGAPYVIISEDLPPKDNKYENEMTLQARSFTVKEGDSVALHCTPIKGGASGFNRCQIRSLDKLRDLQEVPIGAAQCLWIVSR